MVDSVMSSDPTWKRDVKGVEHPAQEALLAFIREQCPQHEKNHINEHLLAGCAQCNRLHAELKRNSNTLNYLKHMSRYLYYPELQSNQVFLHMQRGEPLTSVWTGKRKRKFQVQGRTAAGRQMARRRSAVTGLRVFRLSFPVAFGLLLILTTAAIVLAYTIASFVKLPFALPGQQTNHIYNSRPGQTGIIGHQPTPTPTVAVTITPSASATVTASPTSTAKGPGIDYCLSQRDYGAQSQFIVICGNGFKAGDKVSLVLDLYGRNAPQMWGPFQVDEHGEFRGWFIYSCKNPPIAIYAKDNTSKPVYVVSNILTNVPVTGCQEPTPTTTPGVSS